MSKWRSASTIINDVRAAFARNDSEFRRYGLEHTYCDAQAFGERLQAGTIPPRVASYLSMCFRDWAPLAYWNRYKQVYTMHPALTVELNATGTDDVIPASALRRLPHPDPLIVLPQGVTITLTDGSPGRLVAFHASGATIAGPGMSVSTSTADSTANGLHLTGIAEVHDQRGTVQDWEYCHTSIPLTEDTFTIGGLINADRPHVSHDGHRYILGLADDDSREYVQRVTGIGLAHLLYAVSRSADIGTPRATTTGTSDTTGRLGGAPRRPVKHTPVGYVIGAALDAARADQRRPDSSGDGTRSVRPHVRRAHFHTVRYGPGRSESYVDWFPPIPVKLRGPAPIPTLHTY